MAVIFRAFRNTGNFITFYKTAAKTANEINAIIIANENLKSPDFDNKKNFSRGRVENSYLKITTSYTMHEKLTFIREYFMFKTKHLNMHDKIYILKILKNIPFNDLLQDSTIAEIKHYVNNTINTNIHMENDIYFSLKDKICLKKKQDSAIDNISTFLIIGISIMYYIYIL